MVESFRGEKSLVCVEDSGRGGGTGSMGVDTSRSIHGATSRMLDCVLTPVWSLLAGETVPGVRDGEPCGVAKGVVGLLK